jgi:hypothetical protein
MLIPFDSKDKFEYEMDLNSYKVHLRRPYVIRGIVLNKWFYKLFIKKKTIKSSTIFDLIGIIKQHPIGKKLTIKFFTVICYSLIDNLYVEEDPNPILTSMDDFIAKTTGSDSYFVILDTPKNHSFYSPYFKNIWLPPIFIPLPL